MKNSLLVPELREMLANEDVESLRQFTLSNDPSVTADFIAAMKHFEIVEILSLVRHDDAANIFACFDRDLRLSLKNIMDKRAFYLLLFYMEPETREQMLADLSPEDRETAEDLFESFFIEDKKLREHENRKPGEITGRHDGAIVDEQGNILDNIKVHKTLGGKTIRINRIEPQSWVMLHNPDDNEIIYLSETYGIPRDFLTASLDPEERARCEKEGDVSLIIIRLPYFDESNDDILYGTVALGIILAKGLIITVSSRDNPLTPQFLEGRVKNFSIQHTERFILQIFFHTTIQYLQYLKQMNHAINVIQKKIQEESKNKQLIKLLNLEKSLVYFTTSLTSNDLMMMKVKNQVYFGDTEENRNFFDDIEIENRQAIQMATIYSTILSGMMGAFASIISNNLNLVMKILTSITILLTIPVLITSFYGMNVDLPFQKNPQAFIIIISASLVIPVMLFLFFKARKWF